MSDNAIGLPIPRGVVPLQSHEFAAPAEQPIPPSRSDDWSELLAVGWNIAFLPALTWASFVTASGIAWQSWLAGGNMGDNRALSSPPSLS